MQTRLGDDTLKKLLIAAVLTAPLFQGPAQAATVKEAYCQEVSGLARAVMQARQLGLSLQELLASSESVKSSADELTRKLILSAYTHPDYTDPARVKRAIDEYASVHLLVCVRNEETAP
jgi:hypothetical protein